MPKRGRSILRNPPDPIEIAEAEIEKSFEKSFELEMPRFAPTELNRLPRSARKKIVALLRIINDQRIQLTAQAKSLSKFRVAGTKPAMIVNPLSDTPICLPVHNCVWIAPEGESRGYFEVRWNQITRKLEVRSFPRVMSIKPDCANKISITEELE